MVVDGTCLVRIRVVAVATRYGKNSTSPLYECSRIAVKVFPNSISIRIGAVKLSWRHRWDGRLGKQHAVRVRLSDRIRTYKTGDGYCGQPWDVSDLIHF